MGILWFHVNSPGVGNCDSPLAWLVDVTSLVSSIDVAVVLNNEHSKY